MIHIVDATAREILQKGIKKVGLLGTRFTIEQGFYKERLVEEFGIDVITPNTQSREAVHAVIYGELCLGVLKQSSEEKIQSIIEEVISRGAEGIVLGCTEIPLLVAQDDVSVPVFNTTEIHAKAACNFALSP